MVFKFNKLNTFSTLFGILVVLLLAFDVFAVSESYDVSISLVNQDPDPAVSGDIVEVRLGVENNGDESVDDLVIEIVPEYPFSVVNGNDDYEIISVAANQKDSNMKIVKFNLLVDKEATLGDYDLNIKYYKKDSETSAMVSFPIRVISSGNIEIVSIDKTTLVPGEITDLTFTVKNVGKAPLNDLSFVWKNSDMVILPVGGDNTEFIPELDVSEEIEVSFKVISDTNSDNGLYPLSISISYEDPVTKIKSESTTTAGLYVGGGTSFDVAFSESSSGSVSFSIANVGNNPAYSVLVKVPEQDYYQVSGTDSSIIGNLDKGDYTIASFNLVSKSGPMNSSNGQKMRPNMDNINPANMPADSNVGESDRVDSKASKNEVDLLVIYTDTMGARHSVQKTVTMGTTTNSSMSNMRQRMENGGASQQNFFEQNKYLIGGLLVVLLVWYFYQRRKKKKLLNFKKDRK